MKTEPKKSLKLIKHYGAERELRLSPKREARLAAIAREHGVALAPCRTGGKVFPGWRAAVLAIADGRIPVPAPVVLTGGRGSSD